MCVCVCVCMCVCVCVCVCVNVVDEIHQEALLNRNARIRNYYMAVVIKLFGCADQRLAKDEIKKSL